MTQLFPHLDSFQLPCSQSSHGEGGLEGCLTQNGLPLIGYWPLTGPTARYENQFPPRRASQVSLLQTTLYSFQISKTQYPCSYLLVTNMSEFLGCNLARTQTPTAISDREPDLDEYFFRPDIYCSHPLISIGNWFQDPLHLQISMNIQVIYI